MLEVSKRHIDFLLLDGPPLSGKKSIGDALGEDETIAKNIRVIRFDHVLIHAISKLQEYVPIEAPEEANAETSGSGTADETGNPQVDPVPPKPAWIEPLPNRELEILRSIDERACCIVQVCLA